MARSLSVTTALEIELYDPDTLQTLSIAFILNYIIMQLTSFLSATVTLISSVSAAAVPRAAALSVSEYIVTDLSEHAPSGRPGNDNNNTISFDVWDKDPTTNASTSCSARWDLGTTNFPKSDNRVRHIRLHKASKNASDYCL